ncbi:MAG: phosphatase PAP2 family protein [Clostridia bacterium]|nr:phosphatase PAP2 family protein [Clostridia bacterium]
MNKRRLFIFILGAIAGMLFLAFICLAILVNKNYLFKIDSQTIRVVNNIRSIGLNYFVKVFTYLGSVIILVPVAIILFFVIKGKREKIFVISTFTLAAALSTAMKYLVARNRPDGIAIIEEIGYSFPSAHTVLSLVVYGMVIYMMLKFMKNKPLKIILSIILAILVIAVALSRVYLGVHFMSDIFGGWILGFFVLVLCITCYEFAFKREKP